MKKKIKIKLKWSLILIVNYSFSQSIGINSTGELGNECSYLDVKFDNKGVLFPRVELQGKNDSVILRYEDALVFNTSTLGLNGMEVVPGFYYYRSGLWNKLEDNHGWSINGNNCISGVSNFLGGGGNNLAFMRGGEYSGILSYAYSSFGYNSGNIANNSATYNLTTCLSGSNFGALSGLDVDVAFPNNSGSGYNNSAIGKEASYYVYNESVAIGYKSAGVSNILKKNGIASCAIGFYSLFNKGGELSVAIGDSCALGDTIKKSVVIGKNAFKLKNGLENVVLGNYSLSKNSNKVSHVVAIGQYSMYNLENGNNNIAIGDSAGFNLTSGQNNISFGAKSLKNCTIGEGNIALGFHSGQSIQGSNNVTIGESCDVIDALSSNQLNIGNKIYGHNGKIAIGEMIDPTISFEIHATDGVLVPVGGSSERPIQPAQGMIRFNTDLNKFEGYNGIVWNTFY